MPGTMITVVGLKEVQTMLVNAPKIVVANGFLKALSAAGNVFATAVELRTPVKASDTGGLLDRGVLRESIMVAPRVDTNLRGGAVDVGFGKNGFVALWVEYGHRLVGHKPGKKPKGFVPMHPFMRPAFDSSVERAVEAFTNAIAETVRATLPQGTP